MTLLRRWGYLLLGGALFTPYGILAMVGLPLAVPGIAELETARVLLLGIAVALCAIALTGLLPVVRALEGAVAPALLGGPAAQLVVVPARTWEERLRGVAWWLLHTVVGASVSLASLLAPAVAVSLLIGLFTGEPSVRLTSDGIDVARAWAVPIAVGLVALLVLATWLCGLAAAWSAPWLLGPNPVARVAELERRTRELTERARLARELHDSLGHALTVTTLQASVARRVLESDPAYAAEALAAIEHTSRLAAAELDGVLAMLREDGRARAPQPTLDDLDMLIASHQRAGLPVTTETADSFDVAPIVSREAYRVLQEALTNVHRHAGAAPTSVFAGVSGGRLTIRVCNELDRARRPPRKGGGHGLAGVQERVRLLGGSVHAGPDGSDRWTVEMSVPTGREGAT